MAGQKPAPQLAPAEFVALPQRRRGSRIPTLVWLLLLVLAAAGGWYVGNVVMGTPADYGVLEAKTTLQESELDRAVGTYTIDGETVPITAREAIAQQSSLDAVRNADGSYAMPSAEDVLAAARMAVVQRELDRRQISVTDEEVLAFAQENFGTDDLASLAATYTMDQDTLKARMSESAAMAKLRKEVTEGTASEPERPAEPEADAKDKPTADYAAYIIALAGDEWDGELGIWASEEGPYARALHDFDVSEDGATYEAAQAAYDVAYQLYNGSVTSANTQWTEFVNALLCEARVSLSSLVS